MYFATGFSPTDAPKRSSSAPGPPACIRRAVIAILQEYQAGLLAELSHESEAFLHFARMALTEAEALQLIVEGKANKETAVELGIGMKTVEKHREHLMQKLDIHDTAGLTRYAISSGIIESSVQLTIV